jgi:TPR repeat protein
MQAQNTLALSYLNGDFGYQNGRGPLCQRAAEQGHPGAQTNLGLLYLSSHTNAEEMQQAVDLLYQAAEQDFALPVSIGFIT